LHEKLGRRCLQILFECAVMHDVYRDL
jgi:hypothetical protein